MTDVRLYILGGTFALMVLAIIAFFVTLSRARRAEVEHAVDLEWKALPVAAEQTLDTSLEGMDVAVTEGSASAALLAPLKTGDWIPPESPAPIESLAEAALSERVAHYEPAPDIREPDFSVEQYPEWQVAPAASDPEWAAALPEVEIPASPVEPPVAKSETESSDSVDTFDAEIAALLPEPEPPQPVPSIEVALTEPMPAPDPELFSELATTPVPAAILEPEASPVPEPAPAPEPGPAPEPEPELEPEPVSTPEPAPFVEPAPVLAVEESAAPVEPESQTGLTGALAGDEFWEGAFREQQELQTVARAREPRPEVRVAAPRPEALPQEAAPSETVEPQRPARPRARVNLAPESGQVAGAVGVAASPTGLSSDIPEPPRHLPARSAPDVADVVMAAPVEMWFGDSRVGVKAGTATYDRFRKYADVLLADLQATRQGVR